MRRGPTSVAIPWARHGSQHRGVPISEVRIAGPQSAGGDRPKFGRDRSHKARISAKFGAAGTIRCQSVAPRHLTSLRLSSNPSLGRPIPSAAPNTYIIELSGTPAKTNPCLPPVFPLDFFVAGETCSVRERVKREAVVNTCAWEKVTRESWLPHFSFVCHLCGVFFRRSQYACVRGGLTHSGQIASDPPSGLRGPIRPTSVVRVPNRLGPPDAPKPCPVPMLPTGPCRATLVRLRRYHRGPGA